jgi:DNA polymerase I-like protein with 3'-5' exonuclease and polymerase domains
VTPDQESRLALIRAALPPIYDNPVENGSATGFTSRVCIDCEWSEDGALTTIGVGNESAIVQIAWKEREFDHEWLRQWVLGVCHEVPVVFHNADADIRKLREHGIPLSPMWFRHGFDDTMLADAVLHSEEEHTLEYLCEQYGKLPQHKDLRTVPEAASEYNAADVLETLLIWKHAIQPQLAADPQAERIYRGMSLPFLWLAIESEEAGIRVHPTLPRELYEKYDAKRKQATKLLHAYAGWPVNIGSPDQLKHLLYNVEELPLQYKKGTRPEDEEVTTDKDALAALRRLQGTEWDADVSPTLESAWANIEAGGHLALEARYLFIGAQQAISHYIEPCLDRERIYPECRIHVQASGRVGYVKPALPQMKGELLDQLIPDEGHVWIGHDWSQIEVRLLAVLADDAVYKAAFAASADVHEVNVRAIFPEKGSVDLETIRRRWTKAFAFRLHYRGKPENAADIPGTRALGLDQGRLVAASQAYLAAHPALPPYWKEVEAEADRTGLVRTFEGRPRRLTSPYRNARMREASNHPMQGGVADVYVETALLVKRAAPWARLVFGAYDSHWWSVPVAQEMEFLSLYVPIVEREFQINGQAVSFPAEYKRRVA